MVFCRKYRAMVHRIRGLPSFSTSNQITLLSLLFELSPCPGIEHALLLVGDVTRFGIPIPLLKTLFFSLDSHFVVRAIYLPSLFQPLPRWWKTMCWPEGTSQENYTWCAKIVGSICVMCRPSVNPVGDVNFWKYRLGIMNTRQGEVCMVAPPLLDDHFLHLFKPRRFFFPSHSLDTSSFQLPSRMAIVRTFSSTFIQGRDATRTSHTSRL